jgi:hypothetical protein
LTFGDNAEDVSVSLPDLSAAFPGHALYLLHYGGYGGGSAKLSEAALCEDALALFDKAAASSLHLQRQFAGNVAHYVVIPGADHNTISNSPACLQALRGTQ